MNEKERTRVSKFLSLVLRHEPEMIGLKLDAAGWVDVEDLLIACRRHGHSFRRTELQEVVSTNEKKRFTFSEDGRKIRASQGHSIDVSLGYTPQAPPVRLFHGTAILFLSSIRAEGLRKGARHHVHLSSDEFTARKVGQRHGQPVILVVKAASMATDGHSFFLSENGVWLTDHIPVAYIEFPSADSPLREP